MKKEVLQKLLQKLKIAENTWVTSKNIRKIILTNDADLYLDHKMRTKGQKLEELRLFFDSAKEFLYVKKYTSPIIVSARFNSQLVSYGKGEIIIKQIDGKIKYPGLIYGTTNKLKFPSVGDKIVTFSSSLVQDSVCEILDIVILDNGNISLKLSSSPSFENKIVIWADSKYYDTSEAYYEDPTVLLYSKPINDRSFDTLISYHAIGGVELERIY